MAAECDGNKEKWYGSDRIFMYVMTVFGAMTVNYSEQCTEYRVGRE